MWFYLGIVSFFGVFVYRLWRMLFWAWGWTVNRGFLDHDGRPYKTRRSSHKGTHNFSYAVTCRPRHFFRIKRETGWDRWAKKIGLSVEFQFADPEFDALLYVASDDPDLNAELANVPELRAVLKAIFRNPNVTALKCEGRHLWVETRIKATEPPTEYVNGAAARTIVPALHGLTDYLDDFTGNGGRRLWVPYRIRAVLLVALSSAVLMLGLGEVFRMFYFERGDVMIDSLALFKFATVVSLAILPVWLIAAAAWLKGSAHAHLVLGEVLISGGIGLVFAVYALARDINIEWDEQAATSYDLLVSDKTTGYRRKYGTYYRLGFASVPEGMRKSYEVDSNVYALAKVGDPLTIHVKSGMLGYRWIERMGQTKGWASVECTPDEVNSWTKDYALKVYREGRYPANAKEKGLQGTVDMEVVIDAAADRVTVRILGSSGSVDLDNEAVRAANAVRMNSLICNERRVNYAFRVPVRFRLATN